MERELVLGVVIVAAFVFLLTNGLHDASSVVATFIACGAATPLQAVAWAALLELLGAVTGGAAVVSTVTQLVLLPLDDQLLLVLLAALLAAMGWNVFTWRLGLPSSSTHALVGGLIGAVWIASGAKAIGWGWQDLVGPSHALGGVVKVISGLIISPVVGLVIAFLFQRVSAALLRSATFHVNRNLKRGQWLVTGLMAYSHGANDTQKVIALVVLALAAYQGQALATTIPFWVKLAGGLIMFIGILSGGWKIMKTLGTGIFALRPLHSLNSQLAAGSSLLLATLTGAPVSTTHVVTGAIIGVGAADEYRMVNWNIGRVMLVAWCITIPASAVVAAGVYVVLQRIMQ